MEKNIAIEILKKNGYNPVSDLNFCTDNGIEYYIGYSSNGKQAAVCALIEDENIYLITKPELREMSLSAKTWGVDNISLLTNYGIELHSRYETPQTVGFDKLIKLCDSEPFEEYNPDYSQQI